jgi:hypothetical protein
VAQSKVASLKTLPKINQAFPGLKEIDAEENLLSSWAEIFQILDELKNLKLINVSSNILKFPDQNCVLKAYGNIQSLIVNKMGYTWKDVICTYIKIFVRRFKTSLLIYLG